MVITLFDSPNISDLQLWANEFGIHHAVAADPGFAVSRLYNPDNEIPSMTLLGPGAEIVILDQLITEAQILPHLPDSVPD